MATIETNPQLGAQIKADAEEFVLHSLVGAGRDRPDPVAGAEGRYFWDYDGNRYLDFASQLVNVSIGYGHPKVIAAIKEQAEKLATIGPPMATEPRSTLARMLADVTPGNLKMSFFTNGGAEANENAIEVARWVTGRHKIIAATAATTAPRAARSRSPATRAAGTPSPGSRRRADARSVHLPLPRRRSVPGLLGRAAPGGDPPVRGCTHGRAVILETVVGTNGIIVPPDGYLQSIRETCDRHGILLICDEVMAGFGRTGKWFACDNWDVVPDILTVAKDQLGLRAARRDDRLRADRRGLRGRFLAGGLTYSGHPLACASAVASIEAFQEESSRTRPSTAYLSEGAAGARREHPSVGDVRGLGLFWGSSW